MKEGDSASVVLCAVLALGLSLGAHNPASYVERERQLCDDLAAVNGTYTNRSPFAGPREGLLRWRTELTSALPYAQPCVDANGRILVAERDSVGCFGDDGSLLWSVETGVDNAGELTPSPDGSVYGLGLSRSRMAQRSSDRPHDLFRITPTHELNTLALLESSSVAGPAVTQTGLVVVASQGSGITAYDPSEGVIAWTADLGEAPYAGRVAIDANGIAYVCNSSILTAIQSSGPTQGTLLWSVSFREASDEQPSAEQHYSGRRPLQLPYPTSAAVQGPIIVGKNGILVGEDPCELTAFDSSGAKLWRKIIRAPGSMPAVSTEGTCYVMDADGMLWRTWLNGDVDLLLDLGEAVNQASGFGRVQCAEPPLGLILVDDVGCLYVPVGDELFAVAPSGNIKWSVALDAPIVSRPSIGPSGLVFVYACGEQLMDGHPIPVHVPRGFLYAIGPK